MPSAACCQQRTVETVQHVRLLMPELDRASYSMSKTLYHGVSQRSHKSQQLSRSDCAARKQQCCGMQPELTCLSNNHTRSNAPFCNKD